MATIRVESPTDRVLRARTPPPRVRRDVEIVSDEGDGYIVRDPRSGREFKAGRWEHTVMALLDGTRTPRAVCSELADVHGIVCDLRVVDRFVAALERVGLLTDGRRDESSPLFIERRGLLYMVRLVRPQAWTERAVARLRRLPRPIGLALLIAPMTAALGVTAMRASDMMAAIAAAWTPARFVAALVACVAIGLVHEASHGLAAAWAGARIVSAGVAVYYFRPGLFCEIRGLESLARERRLVVSSAGLASDLFFTSLAVLVWQLVPAAAIAEAALLTAMLLAIRVALNLNPLLKLDGYYILVDLIGRRDLRESAFAALAESVSSWRAIVSRAPRRPLAPLRRGAMVYGVLAIAYVALLAVLGIVALDRWLAARSLDAPAILAMLMVFALASLTDRMVWGRPRKRTT